MDISSLIKAIFDPQPNRSAWIQQIIKPGDVFRLKVIDVKDNHRALVDLGKFRALAEVKFPVKPGADFLVKVTGTEGQLRLQLIDPESRAVSSSKNVSSQLKILSFELFNRIQSDIRQTVHHILNRPDSQLPPEQISRALATLDAHFESIDLTRNMEKWLPLLKARVEDAGLFFEKKFADLIHQLADRPESDLTRELIRSPETKKILTQDLKPILFMLKEYLETQDPVSKFLNTRNLSNFKGSIDMLLADIFNQQTRAAHKLELPDPYHVFSFTLPIKEDQQKAKLKFYYPKKNKNGSKAGFKISLLLDMDKIGEVRADFFLIKKELSITFFVNDNSHKIKFEEHLDEIDDRLAPFFDYLILKTVVSAKKIQDFQREDLDIGSDKQIDLRI
ncbi:MAG: hypothetical protein KAS40_04775 [Desulfobacterales bacterium]|nr:hypothetical protein [Desulfobacterales bacterium]